MSELMELARKFAIEGYQKPIELKDQREHEIFDALVSAYREGMRVGITIGHMAEKMKPSYPNNSAR